MAEQHRPLQDREGGAGGVPQPPRLVPNAIIHNIDTAASDSIRHMLDSGRGCPQGAVLEILEQAQRSYEVDRDWIIGFKKRVEYDMLTLDYLERALEWLAQSATRLCGVAVGSCYNQNAWLSGLQNRLLEHDLEACSRVDRLYSCAMRLRQALSDQARGSIEIPFRPPPGRPEDWTRAKETKITREDVRLSLRDFLALVEIELPADVLRGLIQQVRDLENHGPA